MKDFRASMTLRKTVSCLNVYLSFCSNTLADAFNNFWNTSLEKYELNVRNVMNGRKRY